MLTYISRRVLSAASVVLATIIATFLLFFVAPSDPAAAICGPRCTPARYADIKHSLNLDRPIPVQLEQYLKGMVVGQDFVNGGVKVHCPAPCLGYSYFNSQPVLQSLETAFPVTATVVLGAAVIFFTVGVATGSMAARRRGSPADRMLVGTTLVLSSIPYYVIALIVFLYLTILYPILPRAGYNPISTSGIGPWAAGYLAPWLVLGLTNATAYARYSRGSMVEALSEDYVRTARSKGISEWRVGYVHGLRAAITPVVTILGLDIASQLAGAIFTENIFSLPGIGLLVLQSFEKSDLPVIEGTVIVGAVALVVLNLAVDLIYSVLDPRVRLA